MPRRLTCWLLPLAVGVAGCGSQPVPTQPHEPVAVTPALVTPADPPPTKPTPDPTRPADPPVTLPADLGGQAVEKALAKPDALQVDPPTAKPKAYSSRLDRGEVPLPTPPLRPFAPSPPVIASAKPTPPRERPLLDRTPPELPQGKLADRPLAKAPSPPNPGAADVPGRSPQQPDRVSLDDPTADLTAGRVIQTPLPLATAELPFLRLTIPDPFEFIEHLKGKLGRDGELGTKPVDR